MGTPSARIHYSINEFIAEFIFRRCDLVGDDSLNAQHGRMYSYSNFLSCIFCAIPKLQDLSSFLSQSLLIHSFCLGTMDYGIHSEIMTQ